MKVPWRSSELLEMASIAARAASGEAEVWVIFDNTARDHAPPNPFRLQELLKNTIG